MDNGQQLLPNARMYDKLFSTTLNNIHHVLQTDRTETTYDLRQAHNQPKWQPSDVSGVVFYQPGSIASYASAGIAKAEMSVPLSVRPSVTLRYCIKTKKASVMISSPSDSPNILVSGNMWFIK